jgi:hypothetical protein
VEYPGSTSSNVTPSVCLIASAIASMISLFRPSEKFGTHSIIFFIDFFHFVKIYKYKIKKYSAYESKDEMNSESTIIFEEFALHFIVIALYLPNHLPSVRLK